MSQNFDTRRHRKKRSTTISGRNKGIRLQNGEEHENKPITDFWQYIYFTEEVDFQSKDLCNRLHYELRPQGKYNPETIQELGKSPLDVTLHVCVGISSYNHKGIFLFYKDLTEISLPRPYKPKMSHRSSIQTDSEYTEVMKEREASEPMEVSIETKGNSMVEKFYAAEVLQPISSISNS